MIACLLGVISRKGARGARGHFMRYVALVAQNGPAS
jgi:hypothetical protein